MPHSKATALATKAEGEPMNILKRGDTGYPVRDLQKKLNEFGANLIVDGWFGEKTEQAVIQFQLKHNLPPVGQVGPRTQAALQGVNREKLITRQAIITAAELLNVEPAAVGAVAQVESAGSGFFACGRPAILFERHIFYRQLQAESQQLADEVNRLYPHLCSKERGGYIGGSGEYQRFNMAHMLNPQAAIEACSWGMFQIMGFHWQHLGYTSAKAYKEAMEQSESEHLNALTRFIQADPLLHKALKAKKWADFAKRYNGPAYAENHYDSKLARAYQQLKAVYQAEQHASTAK